MEERRLTYLPFVCGKEQNVSTRGVHLVTLAWMDSLLLDSLDLQSIHLHVKDLTKVHDYRFVDLLPQMRSKNLN